ncbi:MAG TPA: MetS family NSS transporter small subunit [bacterium]|nr:MetS family NSS transporter small subunit [bacterium]HEX67863.1 MetS family NSS transporter small subunit [bacterium]
MPISAWIMFFFGVAVLYGGLAWCLIIALKKRK